MSESNSAPLADLDETAQEELENLEDANPLLFEVTVDTPDGEVTLGEIAADLVVTHERLSDIKDGALALSQSLNEAITEREASDEDEEEVIEILTNLKETAFGAYLRVKRGDDELTGDRGGRYSGYFNE